MTYIEQERRKRKERMPGTQVREKKKHEVYR
jgi:hypothetical protein